MTRTTFAAVACGLTLTLTALTAPAPKGKADAPAGPITEEQLNQSSENLKNIALSFHNYHDTNGFLPTNQLSKDQKPLLSWRVQILPYIEQDHLYKEFKLEEPWDSEHNKKLIERIPDLFAPVRGKHEKGLTFYQGFSGANGSLRPGAKLVASFPDGTSNTFLVAEAAKPVIWTKPDDMIFDGKDAPKVGGLFDGRFHAAMGDGSVRRFKKGIDADLLKRLIDPADGHVINLDGAIDEEEEKK